MTTPDHAHNDALTLDVIAGFRRGERTAFLAVYDRFAAEVRALVGRYFRSPFEREEAVQEIWLNVHQAAASYDPGRGGLGGWIRTVAANRSLQILRAAKRRPVAAFAIADDMLAGAPDPQVEASAARVRAAVAQFAAQLDAIEQAVWQLAFVEGREQDDVARQLGMSVRRYKYLKKKLLDRAAAAPELKHVLDEVLS